MDPARSGDGDAGHSGRDGVGPTAAAGDDSSPGVAPREWPSGPFPIVLNGRAAARPTITGVERFTGEVVARLLRRRPEWYVLAQPRPRVARARFLAQAWEQVALPARAARLRAPLVFSPANLAPLAWPHNVVVLHDAAVLSEPGAYSRAYRAWHRTAGVAAARRALMVVTVSQHARGELITLAGLRPDRMAVIPGGVADHFGAAADPGDAAVLRRLGLERPYVLTVATADGRKNLAALAPAATALRDRGMELAWAGDARPYFAGSRTDTGAPLRRLGYVADADLPALYRGARAFVLPSRHEGFGLTCLEAMACGTPVVAANRAALPETCGDAALLIDPDSDRALTGAVLAAAADPDVRARLRAAGLRRAREFTWERTAAQVDRLLVTLAGVRPAEQPSA